MWKPFTSNVNELDELIALAKQQNCLLFEAITNQYLPTFKEIKEKISEIGKISIISSNYSQYSSRYNAFKRGEILPAFDVNKSGGALMDLNVYNIHFVVGLFGAPNKVEYFANIEKGIDTSGVAILEYPTFKAICIGAKDCGAPIISTIQGDQGCVKIDGPTSVLTDVQILRNGRDSEILPTGNYHRMYSEFKVLRNVLIIMTLLHVIKCLNIHESSWMFWLKHAKVQILFLVANGIQNNLYPFYYQDIVTML